MSLTTIHLVMDDTRHSAMHRSGPTTNNYAAPRSVVPKMRKPSLDVWRNCLPNTQHPAVVE